MLGALAGAGLWLTDLPAVLAVPGSVVCVMRGLYLARIEHGRAPVELVLRGQDARVDGEAVEALALGWRGPLTLVGWRAAGRRHRRVAWPDVVDARLRRELRLWVSTRRPDADAPAVAP
ncbi:MAG TPA: hypothetical protein VIG88_07505 [Lysobacter sp.]